MRSPARIGPALLGAALTCLGACGSELAADANAPFGAQGTEFPLQVRGWDGESFSVQAPPRRILPLNASSVDALNALVEVERVAAVPSTAPEYSTLERARDAWLELPRFEEITATSLLGFEPDLVVGHEWQGASAIPYLRRGGCPVLILPMPLSFEDICREVRTIGAVVGEAAAAEELVADLDQRRATLAAQAGPRRELRALGYSNFGTGGWAAGSETTLDVVISLAGLRNAGAEAGLVSFQEIDHELLLRLDPDFILVAVEAGGAIGPTESFLRGEENLRTLTALAPGGLVRLPRRLNATTSYHMVEAAEELARQVDAWLERGE